MGIRHRWSYESVAEALRKTEISERKASVSGKAHVALIFPAPYSVAMSNLGFLTVHRLLGSISQLGIERFFYPIVAGQPHPPPLYSFETKRPLSDFDILAFSLSYESAFDRLPAILGPLGIPLRASQRKRGRHPVLIAGGAATGSNPYALADIFDLILPGEAEPTVERVFEALLSSGVDPAACQTIPGVWVPALQKKPGSKPPPHDVAHFPAWSHITTSENVFGGSSLIEIMRGCPRQCAFCLARVLYHPPRAVSAGRFEQWLNERPAIRDVGLVAPSLFDYPYLLEILTILRSRGIRIRNSSVKWEKLSDAVLSLLAECGPKSLTLAPETGSRRLQGTMGKPLMADDFYDTIRRVQAHGFEHLKLYFMVGLPQETTEDLDSSLELIRKTGELAKGGFKSIGVSFSGFVPKRGTPWEGQNVIETAELKRRFGYLKMKLRQLTGHLPLKLYFESPHEVVRQAYLAKVGPELALELEKEAKEWQKRGTISDKTEENWDF